MKLTIINRLESHPFFLNQSLEEVKKIIPYTIEEQGSDEEVPNSKYYYSRDLDIKFLFDSNNKLIAFECFNKPISEREIFVDGVKIYFSKKNLIKLQNKEHVIKHYTGERYKIDSLNLIFEVKEFKDQTVSIHYSRQDYFEGYEEFPYKEILIS